MIHFTKRLLLVIMAVCLTASALLSGCVPVDPEDGQAVEELLEAAGLGDHVYWTESDTVFHAYEDCGSLNHSVTLYDGTTQAAIDNGKTGMCKACQERAKKEVETISSLKILEAAGIDAVYWVEGKTEYHAYDDCESLKSATNLFEGTAQAAIEHGKTHLCKTCQERAEKAAEAQAD